MPVYLAGLIFSNMVRIYLTVGFMLLMAYLVFGYHLRGSLGLTFIYVALGVAVFGALGLVVNYVVQAPQAVTSVLNVIFLLMMFSSNTLFIARLPWFKVLSLVSPLTFLTQLLRDNAQGAALQSGWLFNMGVLVACLIVLSAAALRLAQKRVEEG
jgi:ABC-type multidrug transport system permease subunit